MGNNISHVFIRTYLIVKKIVFGTKIVIKFSFFHGWGSGKIVWKKQLFFVIKGRFNTVSFHRNDVVSYIIIDQCNKNSLTNRVPAYKQVGKLIAFQYAYIDLIKPIHIEILIR